MAATGRVIVVAVDKHEPAAKAFRWAMNTLYREGDTFVIVHCFVAPVLAARPGIGDGLASAETFKEEQEKIDAMMQSFAEATKEAGVKGHTVRAKVTGKVGESVLRVADKENADVVVAGTRGMGGFKRAFIGTASDYMLRHSSVPVIVFRDDEQ